VLAGGNQEVVAILLYPAHLAQASGYQLVLRQGGVGIEKHVKKTKGLAEFLHLFCQTAIDKTMDTGWYRRQVVVDFIIRSVPHHQDAELAFEQFFL